MSRIRSVDTVRLIAITAVVVIHTLPFLGHGTPEQAGFGAAAVINQLARFAVPCFFMLSGYFWSGKCVQQDDWWQPTVAMGKRLAILFLVWNLFYLVLGDLGRESAAGMLGLAKTAYWNLRSSLASPLRTVVQGSKYHLWFLPALFSCLVISALALQRRWLGALMVLAVGCYLFALAAGAYSVTPAGLQAGFNPRYGPFVGLIFFAAGCLLRLHPPRCNYAVAGLLLLGAGLALSLAEAWMLSTLFQGTAFLDSVVGTVPAGVGITLLALSNHRSLDLPSLAFAGPIVLGVYAVHPWFIDLLAPLHARLTGQALWEIAHPLAVTAVSLAAAVLLSRWPLTRRAVM